MADRWEKTSTIATVVQTAGVVTTLIFIAYQINQQTNLTQAANAQALVQLMQPINFRLAEHDMAKIWLSRDRGLGQKSGPSEDQLKDAQYGWMLANHLIFYENVFIQKEQGLLVTEVYEGWLKDLESFVQDNAVEKHWAASRDAYQPQFRQLVDDLIAKKPPAAPATPAASAATPSPQPATTGQTGGEKPRKR